MIIIKNKLTERQKKAAITKKKLFNQSMLLFNKYGFDHVSIEQITKACNVSKGTFYTHFATKYDVILEKFKEMDNFYIEIEKKVPEQLKADEKVLFLYKEQMKYLSEVIGKDILRTVYSVALSEKVEKNHFLINPERKIFQLIRTFVDEGFEQNLFKETVTKHFAVSALERCMRANVYDWLIYDTSFDLPEEMINFTRNVLDGLKK